MTHAEAIAWARHLWGNKAYAIERDSGLYQVGAALSMHWKNCGESYHSWEFAFENAGHAPDMNHPAILRAAIAELVAKEAAKCNAPEQVEFC